MKTLLLFIASIYISVDAFVTFSRRPGIRRALKATTDDEEVDVIVVGAGIGGLSCAALASKYGLKTLCLEAHDTPGGCAHSFSRYSSASKSVPFRFDSGPSLVTGLSSMSTNPLRQLLDAVGTADVVNWKKYDGWVVHDYADGKSFKMTSGDGGT
jgi:phytoene dehydrogenase-like protein